MVMGWAPAVSIQALAVNVLGWLTVAVPYFLYLDDRAYSGLWTVAAHVQPEAPEEVACPCQGLQIGERQGAYVHLQGMR